MKVEGTGKIIGTDKRKKFTSPVHYSFSYIYNRVQQLCIKYWYDNNIASTWQIENGNCKNLSRMA